MVPFLNQLKWDHDLLELVRCPFGESVTHVFVSLTQRRPLQVSHAGNDNVELIECSMILIL